MERPGPGRALPRDGAVHPALGQSEAALVEHLPGRVGRMLDLGTGDGRLIDLVRRARPDAAAVGLERSEPMLAAARGAVRGRGPRAARGP